MKEQPWHRRHAIVLAGQLPEGREDALLVLDAARRLVTLPGFWDGEAGHRRQDPQIITLTVRLKLARYCFKAGKLFAKMGERLYRF